MIRARDFTNSVFIKHANDKLSLVWMGTVIHKGVKTPLSSSVYWEIVDSIENKWDRAELCVKRGLLESIANDAARDSAVGEKLQKDLLPYVSGKLGPRPVRDDVDDDVDNDVDDKIAKKKAPAKKLPTTKISTPTAEEPKAKKTKGKRAVKTPDAMETARDFLALSAANDAGVLNKSLLTNKICMTHSAADDNGNGAAEKAEEEEQEQAQQPIKKRRVYVKKAAKSAEDAAQANGVSAKSTASEETPKTVVPHANGARKNIDIEDKSQSVEEE